LVNEVTTLSEMPPAGSSPGSWKSLISMLVKLAMAGSVKSFVKSRWFAGMNPNALA
jgi:hypothetical protein